MFGKPRLIDKHTEAWFFDRFAWILENFSQEKPVNRTELVTPSPEHFPVDPDGASLPEQLLRHVINYSGVDHWTFSLERVDENGTKDLGSALLLYPLTQASPVEANDNEDDCLPITYPDRYDTSAQHLISCFGSHIGWYLAQTVEMPEEFDEEEFPLIADLMAIYLGFGVIRSNTSFDSQSDGEFGWHAWSTERQGFLTEGTTIFATLVFAELAGIEVERVRAGLKPRLHKQLEKARRQIVHSQDDIARLRALEPRNLSIVD